MNEAFEGLSKDGKIDKGRTLFEIAGQMVVGSIVAGAIIMVPVFFILGLYWLGTLLPPESKEASDPTPDSFSAYEARFAALPGDIAFGASSRIVLQDVRAIDADRA